MFPPRKSKRSSGDRRWDFYAPAEYRSQRPRITAKPLVPRLCRVGVPQRTAARRASKPRRESVVAPGCARSQRWSPRRTTARGCPSRRDSDNAPAGVTGLRRATHASSAESSSSSSSRDWAAPAMASRPAARCHAGNTLLRIRLRKKKSALLLASSLHGAPAPRRAPVISARASFNRGRACVLPRGPACSGRGAARPAEPLPRARRMSIVSAMSSLWWPRKRVRMPRRAISRSKKSNRADRAAASLGALGCDSHLPQAKLIPRPEHTALQNRASAADAAPRTRWSKCSTHRRDRRLGQCAQRRSRRQRESAPPENATAHLSPGRHPSAQAATAGWRRSRRSPEASLSARSRQGEMGAGLGTLP